MLHNAGRLADAIGAYFKSVFGMSAIETDQTFAEGITEQLERNGLAVVSNEAAALLAYIVRRGGITPSELDRKMLDLKLVEVVSYDPAQHVCFEDGILPGDPYMKYAPALMDVLAHGAQHFSGVLQ